jgi:hypothetical protein
VAVDTGGGEAASSTAATVRIDCTPPSVTMGELPAEVVGGESIGAPVVDAVDAASGVARTEVHLSVDGGPWVAAGSEIVAGVGRSYVFRARAVDVAGNASAWRVGQAVRGIAPPTPDPGAGGEEGIGGEGPGAEEPGGEVPGAAVPGPHAEADGPAADAGEGDGSVGGGEVSGGSPTVFPAMTPSPVTVLGGAMDPRVRIVHVLGGRRRIVVLGTSARDLSATATVRLRTRGGRAQVRRVRIAGGRWRARFARRGGRRLSRIEVRTPAARGFAAGTAVWLQPLR